VRVTPNKWKKSCFVQAIFLIVEFQTDEKIDVIKDKK
jgi:hypothetical protein